MNISPCSRSQAATIFATLNMGFLKIPILQFFTRLPPPGGRGCPNCLWPFIINISMSFWRPISTSETSGTPIMTYNQNYHFCSVVNNTEKRHFVVAKNVKSCPKGMNEGERGIIWVMPKRMTPIFGEVFSQLCICHGLLGE